MKHAATILLLCGAVVGFGLAVVLVILGQASASGSGWQPKKDGTRR